MDRPCIREYPGNITLVPGDDVGRLSGKILDCLGNLYTVFSQLGLGTRLDSYLHM